MQNIIEQIKKLEATSETLEIPLSQREYLQGKTNAFTNEYIDALPALKSFLDKKANESIIKITDKQKSIEEVLKIFKDEVLDTGIRAASGGHIGYIPGGGIFASAIGDYLAAVSNEYAGVSYASPGAVAIENEAINWLKKIFSFPETAIGNLTSGGSIANLIALTAARDKFQIKNNKIPFSVIYMSEQVHHCIHKSLRIIGLEDVQIRYVKLDEHYRINPEQLKEQILADKANGLNPFLVIASAGTTDVGAIDPLDDIAAIAAKENLWFHVDAAYGGFFILTSKKNWFKGIEKADSLVVDPHKGMFLPYGLGAVLIKDAKAVLHSNHYAANYMQDALSDDLVNDPANVSPELTKHFRGMRIWLPLQLHGIEPFKACLEEKLLLTKYARKRLIDMGFQVGPEPDLSVSYFWHPFVGDANAFNRKLMQNIHEDGTVFLSSTLIKDQFVIRIAILSFRTKLATIDSMLSMIQACLEKTKKEFAL
ncbi:MAG: aminotransferase class V-fold PLP-dependent enzyme [Bacteroidetes bacterium]|nr:aminotransferase class V-fold PLP-dependent enzyme [Bacteroidota bacterium]